MVWCGKSLLIHRFYRFRRKDGKFDRINMIYRIFFSFPACPVESGDERQKSVIPLRGRELTLRFQFHRGLLLGV
jgi:hypothetical protein